MREMIQHAYDERSYHPFDTNIMNMRSMLWRTGPLGHVCREGGFVIISEDFMSDSENAVLLKKGLKGIIKVIDRDGDAGISFDSLEEVQWVRKKHLDKLSTNNASAQQAGLRADNAAASPIQIPPLPEGGGAAGAEPGADDAE
eukprot:gene13082-biopygen10367